jgi:hypothetical protein
VLEDIVVLGKVIPKGTYLFFSTVTGWEDRSSPIVGSAGSVYEDDAIKRDETLNGLRTDGTARKVGFWAAGSGREFVPERWIDGEGRFDPNAGPNGLPFSLGQRACFGKNLAVSWTFIPSRVSFLADTDMFVHQLLEMRLFMCQLNQAFYFAPVPEELNSPASYETITSHPRQCFVKPVSWDSPEAKVVNV